MMSRFTTENGKVSGTKTMLSIFFVLICIKYLLSNTSFGNVYIGAFDGAGAAAILTALGLTYAGRRATESWKNKPPTGIEDAED